MNSIYILLGANLGNSLQQILLAKEKLEEKLGKIIHQSSIYESEAWGVQDQPSFLNQVLLIQTNYDSTNCLLICQAIENDLGRVRTMKWGARVIDIDILYFNQEVIDSETLKVPHPYIQDRKFTLEPLVEIAADYIHPTLGISQKQLLENCTDPLTVLKISK